MDLATLIGIISGFGILIVAIGSQPGGSTFVNIPSMLIVVGGTLAATFITFPLKDVLSAINVARKAFMHQAASPEKLIDQMIELSRKARVEGLLSLEKDLSNMDDEFIKKGLQLMVDGTDTQMLREILTIELNNLEDRHTLGQSIFRAMAEYSPAFGMAGTLIGLIQMLQKLDDPSQIGSGMATALITTLYGVILANLIFIPIAGKLKTRSKEEVTGKELAIEGVCSIQAGDNPRLLRDKLITYIAPSQRKETTQL